MLYGYKLTVTRVIDGDTIHGIVDLGFRVTTEQRFRLDGIDTPEIYRPINEAEREHGYQAKARVEELLLGKEVFIESEKTGKYGRWIARVFLTEEDFKAGRSVGDILVEEGLAKREQY